MPAGGERTHLPATNYTQHPQLTSWHSTRALHWAFNVSYCC